MNTQYRLTREKCWIIDLDSFTNISLSTSGHWEGVLFDLRK